MEEIREKLGLPDWRDEAGYAECNTWSNDRWRWEFLRRRPDVREAFETHKDETYELNLRQQAKDGEEAEKPSDPGFLAMTLEPMPFGMVGIPNPAIGDQPILSGLFTKPKGVKLERGTIATYDDILNERARRNLFVHEVAVVLDRRFPLAQQLVEAKKLLTPIMMDRKTREKKSAWVKHLRVLDARSCGASYREIAEVLFPGKENPNQNAATAVKSAEEVRDNII